MDLGTLNWSVEVDTADLSRAEREMDGTREAATGAKRGIDDFGDSTTRAGRKVRTATERMERDFRSTSRATDMLRNAVSGLVGVLGVREVIRYADAWQNAENMIRLVTRSTGELAAMQERVTRTAIETRSSFEGTARLYSRLAQSTTELALSNSDLIGLTRTINQSFAISGATAEEASNAITQLSQGLQSGALRGEEFNSVAEQAPTILRAVAASLNMGIGELREFAATGGITAEILVDALQGASESIGTQFAGSVATFGQQMEVARTQMTQFIGENSNVRSVVSGLGNVITGVTGSINDHSTAFNVVTGAIGGAATAYYGYATAVGVAQKATVLFMRVLKVNPLILAATAIASIGGAMYAARDAAIEFGDTQGTLTQWMQGTWTTLSNLFKTEFAGAIGTAADAFGPLGQKAGEVATYLWGTFKALLGNILDAAKMTVNGSIAYFLTMRDTIGIVARTIRYQFVNAFDNVLNIAAAFWDGVKSIFSGDIDFSGFQNAIAEGVLDPLANAGGEIAKSFADNFSADYLGDSIQFFSEEMDAFGASVSRNVRIANTEFKTLDGWLLDAPDTISKIPPELEEVSDKAKESATSVSRLDESVNSLLNRLDPVRARTQAYAQGVGLLNTALATGTLNFGDYQRGMVALQEELYNLEDETDKATESMSREWERFGNSVDETFKDAFKGAFDSFDSFADQLKGAFENLMAELAYAAVKNEIKIQLGMGTSGPMSGGIGDIFGGGGGGGLSLRNLTSVGGNVNWIGAPTSYSSGFGSQVATGGVASQGTSFLGGSTSNFSGATGLASLGAGAIGSYTGTELGSSVFGREANSNYGAMAGGAIGTYLGGPVGAFLGSTLGGLADSLFGSGKKTYDFDFLQGQHSYVFGDNTSAFGDFGLTSLTDYKLGEQQDELKAMLQGIAEFDNQIAALAVPERFDAMKEAIDGFTHSGPEDLFETRLRTMIEGGEVWAAEAVSSIADPEKMASSLLGALQLEQIGGRLGSEMSAEIQAAISESRGDMAADLVQQALANANAAELLYNSVERLNVQFDVTAQGALNAAGSISAMVGGIENLAALQSSYYAAYFTEAERAANLQSDLTASLSELGLQLPETRDGFRDLVEAQNLNTDAGAANYATLLQLAGGFDQLRETQIRLAEEQSRLEESAEKAASAEELLADAHERTAERFEVAQDAADNAMRGLQRSIRAEQDRLQTAHDRQMDRYQSQIDETTQSISNLEVFVSSLENAMQSVRVQSDALDYARLQAARGVISSAARSGVTQTGPELESALSIAGQDSQQYYSTFADYARDQAKTAIDIESLYDNSKAELSVEQNMLASLERQQSRAQTQHEEAMARLDRQVEQYQQQIDAILGVDNSVQTVAGAISALEGAIKGLKVAQEQAGGGSGGAQSEIDRIYQDSLGRDSADASGAAYWESTGLTGSALKDAIEYSAWAQGDLPGFANGGTHSGGWRMVGERGPEIEYTGPSRITSNNDIMTLNDELTNEVKQLREDLRSVMRPIAENTGRSAETLEEWNYAGQPPVREEVDA